jgi:regulator of protease activity HflC (stomatin/prohibitin superfamily)
MDGREVRPVRPHVGAGPRLISIVERIGVRLNMMETVLEVPQQSVITRDNAVAAKAAYEVSNLQLAILNQ